jgi:hypothetical protein
MSSTGGRSSEPRPGVLVAPVASDTRPFAVGDRQELRIRRASARREHDLAMVRDQSLEDSAVAYLAVGVQTSEGRCKQGWIWWQDFMRALGESPEQHGELADGPQVRLRIEGYYLRFVVWLVHVRRVQVETARKYFGEALSAHTSFYGPPVPGYNMPRVRKMLRGMEKVIDAPPRRKRRAVRTQDLKDSLDRLPTDSVSAVNARACASVGFCGLLRAAEMSLQRGQAWSKARSLSRADVSFLSRPVGGQEAEWVSFDEVERRGIAPVAAQVMMRPCKKLRYRGGKTVPVFLFDGTILTPVQDLLLLFRIDRVPPERYDATPLFRRASGASFTTDYVREVVRFLMHSVGLAPELYGGHSLRIGGASAALAANVSEAVIRAMGRWDSDVYELYLRYSLTCARQMGSVIASTSFEDFEAMFDHEEFVRS